MGVSATPTISQRTTCGARLVKKRAQGEPKTLRAIQNPMAQFVLNAEDGRRSPKAIKRNDRPSV